MHGYWFDRNYGPGRTRATIMVKAVEGEWYDSWTLDQIKWVEHYYRTLSGCTLIRKQELMGITSPTPQQPGLGQSGLGKSGLGSSTAADSQAQSANPCTQLFQDDRFQRG